MRNKMLVRRVIKDYDFFEELKVLDKRHIIHDVYFCGEHMVVVYTHSDLDIWKHQLNNEFRKFRKPFSLNKIHYGVVTKLSDGKLYVNDLPYKWKNGFIVDFHKDDVILRRGDEVHTMKYYLDIYKDWSEK